MPIKPSYLILAGGGAIIAIAGLKGWGIGSTFRDVIAGHNPAANPTIANQITGSAGYGYGNGTRTPSGSAPTGNTGAASTTARANQALARAMVALSHPSWASGKEWADWVSLWNQESGWNNLALNPSSGAFGIAQALGHGGTGTGGKYGNQYGPTYGLSDLSARAANNGSALPQIVWGIGYIASRYGSPSAAWAHEVANNWY